MKQGKNILYSRTDHRLHCGAWTLHAAYLSLQMQLRVCNTYCFSSAAMVVRTRFSVTLYVHCSFVSVCFFRVCTGLSTSQSIIHENLPNNRKQDPEPRKTGKTRPHLLVNLKMMKWRITNIPRTLHVPRTCR
jgi:hypothetical protein